MNEITLLFSVNTDLSGPFKENVPSGFTEPAKWQVLPQKDASPAKFNPVFVKRRTAFDRLYGESANVPSCDVKLNLVLSVTIPETVTLPTTGIVMVPLNLTTPLIKVTAALAKLKPSIATFGKVAAKL